MTTKQYLDLAAGFALNSTMQQHRLGALIVSRGGKQAAGWNIKKTHPRFRTRSIHAEMKALLVAAYHGIPTRNATIYVARPRRCGGLGLAKPCPICLLHLKEAGITSIIYSANHGYERMSL